MKILLESEAKLKIQVSIRSGKYELIWSYILDYEDRWLTFGISEAKEYLIVWHTESDDELRIIGARKMDKSERKQYEQYKR